MVRINLRDFYPFTQEDTYIEVSAEVANMMNAFERAEASYERKIRRYKAYYSLDHKSGIERSILFTSHSPEELYERKLTREELHTAIAQLPDKQAKRIYAHYLLGMSKEEIARVKGLGFLNNKGTDYFNGRVITRNGKITSKEMVHIANAAEKFGNGEVVFTTRLTVEIRGVHFDNIEPMREFLAQEGLITGGTGAKVRPVVSCKGTTCQFGQIDTFDLSEKIHERFFVGYHDVKLPHKCKIAVGGCIHNCVKPDLNDIGIIGIRTKNEDGKACPGYKICIGGRWGKKTAKGQPLSKIFTSEEEVLDTIEKIILFYKENGLEKERFADTIARIGFEEVEKQLLS